MSTSAGTKRGHDQLSSDSESCGSNAVHFKVDPKTGEQFKYSRKVDEWELSKFIIVESLYSKNFRDSLEKYIQIFYFPSEYSEEIDRAELVKFICAESILYTTSFKNSLAIYIQTVHYPAYKPIPRSVIISEIRNQFRKYQDQMIENFKSLTCKVSLGIDIAHTDLSQVDVLCMTAYWIDDNFIMQKRILAYRTGLTNEFQDGGTIGEMLSKFARRYCIGDKFFAFSSYFKENTNESVVKELKHRYVKCACHILNLIVTDVIARFEPEIRKIRKAMRCIKCCSCRETEFSKKCLDDHNHLLRYLILDIPTRWNTTYDMLVRALEHKAIVTEAYNESVDGNKKRLNNIDWSIYGEIVNFLEKFHNATLHFSGSYYPTCNSALVYLNDISSLFLKYKDNPYFSKFLPRMRGKFIKHFIPVPPIYLLGALLDPMMKLQHIELSLKCLYQNLDLNYSEQDLSSHKEELLKLANEIYSGYEVPMPPSSSSSSSSSKRFPGCEFWQQHVMSHESRRSSNSNELGVYLEQQHDIDESDFDLLAWWKENTKKFPVLSRMARDVLAVPVSTIPSDRVFSQDALQIWEKENLLGDGSVERVECLKDWVRAERKTQGTEEIDSEFLEELENEFEGKCNMEDGVTEFSEAEVNELLSKFK